MKDDGNGGISYERDGGVVYSVQGIRKESGGGGKGGGNELDAKINPNSSGMEGG